MHIRGRRVAAIAVALAMTLGLASTTLAHTDDDAFEQEDDGADRARGRSLLVHITSGPEAPTRAALGFLIAKAAVESGNRVTIFLAGDGAHLIEDEVIATLVGVGTGSLATSFATVRAAGVPILISGGSAAARGITADDLAGKNARFAGPPDLVRLTFEHKRVLVY